MSNLVQLYYQTVRWVNRLQVEGQHHRNKQQGKKRGCSAGATPLRWPYEKVMMCGF